jgi:hypothetical protein
MPQGSTGVAGSFLGESKTTEDLDSHDDDNNVLHFSSIQEKSKLYFGST